MRQNMGLQRRAGAAKSAATGSVVIGMARLRTRSLWLPVGLHGGWIFGIGLFAAIAKASKAVARDQWLPWVGETLKSGLIPLAVLALTGLALAWLDKPTPSVQSGA